MKLELDKTYIQNVEVNSKVKFTREWTVVYIVSETRALARREDGHFELIWNSWLHKEKKKMKRIPHNKDNIKYEFEKLKNKNLPDGWLFIPMFIIGLGFVLPLGLVLQTI